VRKGGVKRRGKAHVVVFVRDEVACCEEVEVVHGVETSVSIFSKIKCCWSSEVFAGYIYYNVLYLT
jgi:hypothetical protein